MTKWFPLQHDYGKGVQYRIPWDVAEKAYAVYASYYGRGQSLERLAERGGFSVVEVISLLSGGDGGGNKWVSDWRGLFPEEK